MLVNNAQLLLLTITYLYMCVCVFNSFVPAALEPRPQFVEPLEQLRRSLEPQRRERENFHVALDRRVGGNAHVGHCEEATRPVDLDALLIVGICTHNCNLAVFHNTLRERRHQALIPLFVCIDGVLRSNNQQLHVDERTGALFRFFG